MSSRVLPRRRGRPSGSEGPELLAIARELFINKGYRGTTMDSIAADARISKQSLYAAYASKAALYAAVVRDWVDLGYDALAPATKALAETTDVQDGLLRLAGILQAGILSTPVRQMRTLIAAEADAFPDVAADYVTRSWDRNLSHLAKTLRTLHRRGLVEIDNADTAAEQFVWLVIAAPLNRLSLQGIAHHYSDKHLRHVAVEAVTTFLSRFGPATAAAEPRPTSG